VKRGEPDICPEVEAIITPEFAKRMSLAPETPAPADPDAVQRAVNRWKKRGVPPEPLCRVLGAEGFFGPTQSLQGARKLQDALWAVVVGHVGCGKSTAAAWWLTRFPSGEWRPSWKLARLPDGPQWARREFADLEAAPALVVDEVGYEDGDGQGRLAGPLQRLMWSRLEARLPTLWTTNVAPAAELRRASAGPWPGISLEEYMGEERLRDRWRQHGRYHASGQASLRGANSG
jgi:hypothetical protein